MAKTKRNITLSDEGWSYATQIAEELGLSRSQTIEMLLKYAVKGQKMAMPKFIDLIFKDGVKLFTKK